MAIDWWTNSAMRKKLSQQLEKKISEQIAATELAYKNAKIPGRAPKHWMGKVSKLRASNRQLPKGLEHLAKQSNPQSVNALLDSLNLAAKEYYKIEYSSIRSRTLRETQKKYIKDNPDNESQITGGQISGAVRKLKRIQEATNIIEAYLMATLYCSNRKPLARKVAKWYVENHHSTRSISAITQLLKREGVAI